MPASVQVRLGEREAPAIGGPDTAVKNSVVSAVEELRDRGVGARQRFFIRQEDGYENAWCRASGRKP